VIRQIFDMSEFVPKYILDMEKIVHPLLECVQDIENIDFDDDISLLLTSIMKGCGTLTETVKLMFKLTPAIHDKYKGVFGNLL